ASEQIQWIYPPRDRYRTTHSALPPHPDQEAENRLVRDNFRELHGRRWQTAGNPGSVAGELPRRSSWRLALLRVDRPNRSRSTKAPQEAGATDEDSFCFRPPVLGQRGWKILSRSAPDSLHIRRSQECGRENKNGEGVPGASCLRGECEQLRRVHYL